MIACPNCHKLVFEYAEGRIPPWCPHCGADMKAVLPPAAEAPAGQTGGTASAPPPAPRPVAWQPPQAAPRPRSQLLPLVLIGAVCLVGGVYLVARLQQSAKAPTSAPSSAPTTAPSPPRH